MDITSKLDVLIKQCDAEQLLKLKKQMGLKVGRIKVFLEPGSSSQEDQQTEEPT